jgi:hypothetical protein
MKSLVSFPLTNPPDDFLTWSVKGESGWSDEKLFVEARACAWEGDVKAAVVVNNGQILEVCDASTLSLFQLALTLLTCEACNGCELCCMEGECQGCGQCEVSDFDDTMDGDAGSALSSAGFGTDEDYGGPCDFES